MKLLEDGKNAFIEIKNQIKSAKKSIYINMFIWRNDTIGNELAELVLDALNRGVKVTISKDRYGVICECAEENKKSFFHRSLSLVEKIKIAYLIATYNKEARIKTDIEIVDDGTLYNNIINHPNFTLDSRFKCDHSKYYIFDEEKVIMGGVNIEDKENGIDYSGRKYHDYMVYIDEIDLVNEFISLKDTGISTKTFFANRKEPISSWKMKQHYLDLINNASKELTIVMAYFSPLKKFISAIVDASNRGVNVRIITSKYANFQDDLNKKTLNILMNKSNNKIKCFYYDGMLHAKLLMNESLISFGSCNITKKAFNQLDELNIALLNDDSDIAKDIRESVENTFSSATKVLGKQKYNKVNALLESTTM